MAVENCEAERRAGIRAALDQQAGNLDRPAAPTSTMVLCAVWPRRSAPAAMSARMRTAFSWRAATRKGLSAEAGLGRPRSLDFAKEVLATPSCFASDTAIAVNSGDCGVAFPNTAATG